MTVVVQKAMCLYAGCAWALKERSLYKGVRACDVTKGERSVGGLFNTSSCAERRIEKQNQRIKIYSRSLLQ